MEGEECSWVRILLTAKEREHRSGCVLNLKEQSGICVDALYDRYDSIVHMYVCMMVNRVEFPRCIADGNALTWDKGYPLILIL